MTGKHKKQEHHSLKDSFQPSVSWVYGKLVWNSLMMMHAHTHTHTYIVPLPLNRLEEKAAAKGKENMKATGDRPSPGA